MPDSFVYSSSALLLWIVIAAGVSIHERDWRPFVWLAVCPVVAGLVLRSLNG